jgi:hypothetical protein
MINYDALLAPYIKDIVTKNAVKAKMIEYVTQNEQTEEYISTHVEEIIFKAVSDLHTPVVYISEQEAAENPEYAGKNNVVVMENPAISEIVLSNGTVYRYDQSRKVYVKKSPAIPASALDMINSRLTDMENTTYSDIG